MAKKSLRTAANAPSRKSTSRSSTPPEASNYLHPTADSPLRPDVGTQAQFRKKKPPAAYRYDSSLAPEMNFDGQNPAREQGEAHIRVLDDELHKIHRKLTEATDRPLSEEMRKSLLAELTTAQDAAAGLKALSRPFLNWSGKAERLSFDVPTLPLFVHERLSTRAIIDTLTGHQRDQQMALFADPQRSIADQVLKAYEYRDGWVNRMILGDSLVVMNSLLHYEGLGGQVQMIYMDPPYGVKFGSNFQPFVRKRDVSHNDDDDMTREPEMVKAYRDTWELGLHSYLTYLRDRLLVARELLHPSGSVFVQISDDNVHHVRELMDEVFGPDNFVALIPFVKTAAQSSELLPSVCDYLLWYGRDKDRVKFRSIFRDKSELATLRDAYSWLLLSDGSHRKATAAELDGLEEVPQGSKLYRLSPLTSQRPPGSFPFTVGSTTYLPGKQFWKTHESGLRRCAEANRLQPSGKTLFYRLFLEDFPAVTLSNVWTDTQASFGDKFYVVQTSAKVVQRCMMMTTDPGDLVLDPTCGSGTTAYVAEQWGRRWITADVSRVPLALARQRLLTATFPWYELKEDSRGPAGGFVYKRRQNNKGEEVGGIVPHVTLKSIANNEPPDEEVLVDRPEEVNKITRVTGPFCVEASIPAPMDWSGDAKKDAATADGSFVDRMLEVLRKSPVLHLAGNRTVTLRNVRPPAKSLSLSAEAMVEGHAPGSALTPAEAVQVAMEQNGRSLPFTGRPVALVFGPENGAVSEKLVYEAAREAHAKGYTQLYVIGFAIEPNARKLVDDSEAVVGVPATYVQATPDLLMGDLLKNMRSSQIFSVCGLPEVKVSKADGGKYQVELVGVDVFDPVTMENDSRAGGDVPCWLLDTDYNGLCFHVCQAFFPRTAAWDNLKRSLRAAYDESVWDHLAGSISAPFEPGEKKQIAVKVIDDRGNELLVVNKLA